MLSRIADVEAKMKEYITNGARLGWLLDAFDNRAYIYRPGETPNTSTSPRFSAVTPYFQDSNLISERSRNGDRRNLGDLDV